MKCIMCKHGELAAGTTTVTVDRNNMTIVLRHVPASICQTCGADYVDGKVMAQVEKSVTAATRQGTVVEVREFAA